MDKVVRKFTKAATSVAEGLEDQERVAHSPN